MKKILAIAFILSVLFLGCDKDDSTKTEIKIDLIIEGSVTNVSEHGKNDGAIDVNITGGKSPYSYTWLDGNIEEDRVNISVGDYKLTVKDADGQSKEKMFSVTSPDLMYLEKSVLLPIENDGSIDITIHGGVEPYVFSWSNAATSEDISDLAAGVYILMVKDANNVQLIDTTNLFNQLELSLIITNESYNGAFDGKIVCESTGGVEPYTYKWNNDSDKKALSGLVASNYSCEITDATGYSITKSATVAQILTIEVPETLNYIQAYKQSSLRIDDNGTIIYIDPAYITGNAEDADIVFTSHNHDDHIGSNKFGSSNAKFVSPQNCKNVYANATDDNFYLAIDGASITIGDIQIEVVPAYNSYHPRGEMMGVGYVITLSNGTTIYFMGDTDLIPEMKDIDCDIVFVPLGQIYTMSSVQNAATAVEDCNAEIAIPIHIGVYEGKKSDIVVLNDLLAPKGIDVVVLPQN